MWLQFIDNRQWTWHSSSVQVPQIKTQMDLLGSRTKWNSTKFLVDKEGHAIKC